MTSSASTPTPPSAELGNTARESEYPRSPGETPAHHALSRKLPLAQKRFVRMEPTANWSITPTDSADAGPNGEYGPAPPYLETQRPNNSPGSTAHTSPQLPRCRWQRERPPSRCVSFGPPPEQPTLGGSHDGVHGDGDHRKNDQDPVDGRDVKIACIRLNELTKSIAGRDQL